MAADLTWIFDEQYPGLTADPGYVAFLWTYAGLLRLDAGHHHLFYLFGFGPATADNLHDLHEDLADEDRMFTFAECTVDGDLPERPLDADSVDFGFDLTGSRRPGVYRYESTTHGPRAAWVWHTDDFASFLAEAVATGGVWPRPQLGPGCGAVGWADDGHQGLPVLSAQPRPAADLRDRRAGRLPPGPAGPAGGLRPARARGGA
jgi:hypothetical protein